MQGDTALHIAMRKSSIEVEKIIRSQAADSEVMMIYNNVSACTILNSLIIVSDIVIIQLGETPDTVKLDESEYISLWYILLW